MRQRALATAAWGLGLAMLSGIAGAQAPGTPAPGAPAGPVGPAAEAQRNYAAVKKNILKSADLMPAESYSFKPVPDIRVYARIVNHVTEAQFRSCGVANGTAMKDIAKPPADTADKATVVAALQASFAECDKAYAALTDANLAEMLTAGPTKRSRIGLLWGNASHDNEQYAQLAIYLRLKGIQPPSAEK